MSSVHAWVPQMAGEKGAVFSGGLSSGWAIPSSANHDPRSQPGTFLSPHLTDSWHIVTS
jgi:hypothetical protein